MDSDGSPDQPLERMIEQPDIESLRESYKSPSRVRLRLGRIGSAIVTVLANRTLWTVVLALAIVAVLVFGYLQLD